jgi:hypothetical protein
MYSAYMCILLYKYNKMREKYTVGLGHGLSEEI